jgi:hypothetical protein
VQYKRPILNNFIGITDEKSNINDKPYVFMIATLWPMQNCVEGTNLLRKKFIEVCRTLDCNFEGGFLHG